MIATPQTMNAKPKSSRTRRHTKAELPPHEPVTEHASPDEPSYTIDALAARTGVPSRTIRFYQSSGVLPKPQKRGRVAYYGSAHVERLELIGKMQDRGLRMRAIKELLERSDSGEVEIAAWLGLEQQLSSAWTDDVPRVMTRAELDERLGERRPGFIAELARGGMLEIQSEDAYLVASPGLLQIAARFDDTGVSVEVATEAVELLRRHLAKVARELAASFTAQLGERSDASADELERTFSELRGVSLDATRLIFAREMEEALRTMVRTGAVTRLDKKTRKRKRKRKR